MSGRGRDVVVVVGTRPEAIKLAPVVLALHRTERVNPVLVSTGQHRQMTTQVLHTFGLSPDIDLQLGREQQTLTNLTAAAVTSMNTLLDQVKPAAVVVQGDTTTAFAAALTAFYAQTPIAHVEAGLRSGERYSPFPEEVNRRLTAVLTDLHLAPTRQSRHNLLTEGIPDERILVTGNTVIDALLLTAAGPPTGRAALQAEVNDVLADPRPMVLVTMHRRESWGAPMVRAMNGLARVAEHRPDVLFVFPVHPNPVVRDAVGPVVQHLRNIWLIEPQDYAGFVALLRRCTLALTDSGGIQEEAPSLGKPVLVMRDNTERPEGIIAGTARLVGTDPDVIARETTLLLSDPAAYQAMAQAINPYGDGHAAERSAGAIEHLLGLRAQRPTPFNPFPTATPTSEPVASEPGAPVDATQPAPALSSSAI